MTEKIIQSIVHFFIAERKPSCKIEGVAMYLMANYSVDKDPHTPLNSIF